MGSSKMLVFLTKPHYGYRPQANLTPCSSIYGHQRCENILPQIGIQNCDNWFLQKHQENKIIDILEAGQCICCEGVRTSLRMWRFHHSRDKQVPSQPRAFIFRITQDTTMRPSCLNYELITGSTPRPCETRNLRYSIAPVDFSL
jgi:hypothetical protein